jgi:hypothetical protein
VAHRTRLDIMHPKTPSADVGEIIDKTTFKCAHKMIFLEVGEKYTHLKVMSKRPNPK